MGLRVVSVKHIVIGIAVGATVATLAGIAPFTGVAAATESSAEATTATTPDPNPTPNPTPTPTPPAHRPRPPLVLQPAGLHNFATTSRWVVLHRGSRVIQTLIITPKVTNGVIVPAIEFAHGWDSNPVVYINMLRAWASTGCLVIAPRSPGMARGSGLLPSSPAISRQIRDLPAVLTQVLAMKMNVVINRKEIAVAGHSDGGTSVATMAFNRGYSDRRIAAYLVLSGGTSPENSGRRHTDANTRPVFIADSYADQFNNWPSAATFFRQADGRKVLVGVGRGETHLTPWAVVTPFNERLWLATVDFVRWAATGTGAALTQMVKALRLSGFGVNLD